MVELERELSLESVVMGGERVIAGECGNGWSLRELSLECGNGWSLRELSLESVVMGEA